jgi:ribosome biogenesis GTPase A
MANEEKSFQKSSINWYPGHMAKTKRLIKENIDKVDIIYEVIDARIPLSSKIKDKDIDILTNKKPRILIMTKADLCDLSKTNLWVKYYENKGYKVVLADLINNKGVSKILDITNLLLKDLDEKREAKGLNKRRYRALIIGIPNVGKSTLINRLVGKKAAVTGNKPGVTKSLSWIRINNNVDLLDSPGILWPKLENKEESYNLASFSAIKEEVLPKGKVACYILDTMYKKYKDNLKERYGIDEFDMDDVVPTYDIIGKSRGCLISGGEIDYDKVSGLIINDLKEGRLGKVTFDEVK